MMVKFSFVTSAKIYLKKKSFCNAENVTKQLVIVSNARVIATHLLINHLMFAEAVLIIIKFYLNRKLSQVKLKLHQ